jgi:putative transcriptional regulator
VNAASGPLRGRLLVASPRLGDPNFDRAVVVVLDHTPDGALGVILNRPTHAPVGEILDPWVALAERTPPSVVFAGGPVAHNAVIGLARRNDAAADPLSTAVGSDDGSATTGPDDRSTPRDQDDAPDELVSSVPWRPVLGSVGTVDLSVDPVDQPLPLDGVRLFAGYAGWSAGQLDTEMDADAWFAVDAVPGDVFTPRPDELWRDVLKRQHGGLALLASYPPHPSVN